MITDRLCVIPCGKRKIWDKHPESGPTAARYVYTAGLAKATREYAEHFYENWVILSARHGFLFPDDLVPGAYDTTFLRPDANVISDADLKLQVVKKNLHRFKSVDIVAGSAYCAKVQVAFSDHRVKLQPVLAGLRGMGYMLSAMTKALKSGHHINKS